MPLVTAGVDAALNGVTADLVYASLHTAYSATGGDEVSGGSYARQAVTWASASSGSAALNGTLPTWSVPASTTVEYVGFWSESSSGTFYGMIPIGGDSSYGFVALETNSIFYAPGSAYSNTNTVVIFPTVGSETPGGFTAGTVYYVIDVSGDTFELSTTSGGDAVSVSADGSGLVTIIAPQAFGSAGTLTLSSGSLSAA